MSSQILAEKVRRSYPRAQEHRGFDEVRIIDMEDGVTVIGQGRTALEAWKDAMAREAAALSRKDPS